MGDITGYRELSDSDIRAINNVKAAGEKIGLLVAQVRAMPDVDQRWAAIAVTNLQTGFMALVRAIARPTSFVFALMVLLTGCSGGLSEVAMVIPDDKDGQHYIVNRDLVHDRVWANQHQLNGDFHCTKMRSSEEMAELRSAHGPNVVKYINCTPLNRQNHPYAKNQLPGAGAVWLDSAKAVLYSATAAYVGHEIGKGIGRSGDQINQQGGGASAENMTNSGNTSVKGNTNINSNNKNIMK